MGDLLNEIIRRYPPMGRDLLNEQGELFPHVHFFINGRDAPYLKNGMDTILNPDDAVRPGRKPMLIDAFGRAITYLRISLTD